VTGIATLPIAINELVEKSQNVYDVVGVFL
jgi:hypothetical protein